MASAFAHALVGYTLGKLSHPRKKYRLLMIVLLVSTILPDIDVIAFSFGIPYESQWGHRGFTHSIFFALCWSGLLVFMLFRTLSTSTKSLYFLLIFLATLSHGLLDAMTSGGLGIAFFWPLDHARYFLPWRVIKVSPIGIGNFFSEWGLKVLWSELLWVGIPAFMVLIINYSIKKGIRTFKNSK